MFCEVVGSLVPGLGSTKEAVSDEDFDSVLEAVQTLSDFRIFPVGDGDKVRVIFVDQTVQIATTFAQDGIVVEHIEQEAADLVERLDFEIFVHLTFEGERIGFVVETVPIVASALDLVAKGAVATGGGIEAAATCSTVIAALRTTRAR